MAKAIWNGKVIAESPKPLVVEGNLYFPAETVNFAFPAGQRYAHCLPLERRSQLL